MSLAKCRLGGKVNAEYKLRKIPALLQPALFLYGPLFHIACQVKMVGSQHQGTEGCL